MGIVIRPFRETDRAAVIALSVAAFPGVSIEHTVDERLGTVAGRDWQWRKGRDVELDIDSPGYPFFKKSRISQKIEKDGLTHNRQHVLV